MKAIPWIATTAAALVVLCAVPAAPDAHAQPLARRAPRAGGPAGGAGAVRLPHAVVDAVGNQWRLYQGGWVQQQGNQPMYAQGAVIVVNGNAPQMHTNVARFDEKTGDVIFDNLQAGPVAVTRRVKINREEGYVRYVDVLRNAQGQEQTVDVQYQTSVNFGIAAAETIDDPRRKGQDLAWVAQTDGARAVVEVYAGKGSKLSPAIEWQPGNNQVTASFRVTVPPSGEAAVMHLHATATGSDTGRDWALGLKESALLRELPAELRKLVVNFVQGQQFVGDRELLRGETFDVVELRGGDQVRGTLTAATYRLDTFYGPVELPAGRVIGLINVGEFRPRQLLVTVDGEVFGGKLARDTLALELTSGQVTNVPLAQVARAGYRRRDGEPEEWAFDKPFVMMRTGDRIAVAPPAAAVEVMTRYGRLAVGPASIAAVAFQSQDTGVHEVALTDGSRFAGLVVPAQFEMKLAGTASAQVVTFPTSGIARLQFVAEPPEPGETDPTLRLAGGDLFVGVLAGQLKLDTAFDTLTIEAAEVRRLARPPEAVGLDVQVTLWDDTVVSGQLQEGTVPCALKSGLAVTVPIALVEQYEQPEPRPSAGMTERITAKVADLNADDWKQRDRAEAELVAIGPVVVPVLKSLRAGQSPEAQQRIDVVLAALAKKKGPAEPAGQPIEQ